MRHLEHPRNGKEKMEIQKRKRKCKDEQEVITIDQEDEDIAQDNLVVVLFLSSK